MHNDIGYGFETPLTRKEPVGPDNPAAFYTGLINALGISGVFWFFVWLVFA